MIKEPKTFKKEIKEKMLASINGDLSATDKKTQKKVERTIKKAAEDIAKKLLKAAKAAEKTLSKKGGLKNKKSDSKKGSEEVTSEKLAAGVKTKRLGVRRRTTALKTTSPQAKKRTNTRGPRKKS